MDLFGRKARAELSVTQAMLAEQGDILKGAVALLTERDRQVNVLAAQIKLLTTPPPVPVFSAQPLYMSEDEEDLKYQLDSNLIDVSTYTQMLKELEFENAEVSLAVEDLPENFHY